MNAPCMGCGDRWVTEHGICHSTCDKYRAFRAHRERVLAEKRRDMAALTTAIEGEKRRFGKTPMKTGYRNEQ